MAGKAAGDELGEVLGAIVGTSVGESLPALKATAKAFDRTVSEFWDTLTKGLNEVNDPRNYLPPQVPGTPFAPQPNPTPSSPAEGTGGGGGGMGGVPGGGAYSGGDSEYGGGLLWELYWNQYLATLAASRCSVSVSGGWFHTSDDRILYGMCW
jgi:hypothetical protein